MVIHDNGKMYYQTIKDISADTEFVGVCEFSRLKNY